jgi:tetratricopeptide (TPR) repeat protein
MSSQLSATGFAERFVVLNGVQSVGVQNGEMIFNAGQLHLNVDAEVPFEAIRIALERVADDTNLRTVRNYLSAVRSFASAPYHHLPLPGGLTLADVYVGAVLMRSEAAIGGDSIHKRTASLSELLSDRSVAASSVRILIEGGPGSGKSTFMRMTVSSSVFAGDQSDGVRWIPMPLRVQAICMARGAALGERLWNALGIANELILDETPSPQYFSEWPRLLGARWLLMLDGADEIDLRRAPEAIRWLTELWGRDLGIVISSRDSGELHTWLSSQATTQRLEVRFGKVQRLELATKLLADDAPAFIKHYDEAELSTMHDTPLFVTLASCLYADRRQLPTQRIALVEQMVQRLLREMEQRSVSETVDPRLMAACEPVLEQLAVLMSHHPEQVTLAELAPHAARRLAALLGESPELMQRPQFGETLLRLLGRHSGIIGMVGDTVVWTHAVFREFLCAKALKHTHPRELSLKWLKDSQGDASTQEIISNILNLSDRYELWIHELTTHATHDRVIVRVADHVRRDDTCSPQTTSLVLREVCARVLDQREGGICSALLSPQVIWSYELERLQQANHVRAAFSDRVAFLHRLAREACKQVMETGVCSNSLLLHALEHIAPGDDFEPILRDESLSVIARIALMHQLASPPTELARDLILEAFKGDPDSSTVRLALTAAPLSVFVELLRRASEFPGFFSVAKDVFEARQFRDSLQSWSDDATLSRDIRISILVAMASGNHGEERTIAALDRLTSLLAESSWDQYNPIALRAGFDTVADSETHKSQLFGWIQARPPEDTAHWLCVIDTLLWYLNFMVIIAARTEHSMEVRAYALQNLVRRYTPTSWEDFNSDQLHTIEVMACEVLSASESGENVATLHAILAIVRFKTNDSESAEAEARKAHDVEPSRWASLLAHVLHDRGLHEEVLELLNPDFERGTLSAWSAIDKAGSETQLLRFREAYATFQGVPFAAFNAFAWLQYGYAATQLSATGELEWAFSCFDRALELEPEASGWRAFRCSAYLRAQKFPEALADAEKIDLGEKGFQTVIVSAARFAAGDTDRAMLLAADALCDTEYAPLEEILRLLGPQTSAMPPSVSEDGADPSKIKALMSTLLDCMNGKSEGSAVLRLAADDAELSVEAIVVVMPLLSIAASPAAAQADAAVQGRCSRLFQTLEYELIIRPSNVAARPYLAHLSPMYCRKEFIAGTEPEHERAKRILAAVRPRGQAIALLEVDTTDFIFGLCNFRGEPGDQYDFKFLERRDLLEKENIAVLARMYSVTQIIVVTEEMESFVRGTVSRHRLYCQVRRMGEPAAES